MSQKTVLITGAAKRIGRFLAISFAKDGWRVIGHYNTSFDDAKSMEKEILDFGGSITLVQSDFATNNAAQLLFDDLKERNIIVDCLVNNASTFEKDTLKNLTLDSWDFHISPNLKTPLFLSKFFVNQLSSTGNIINILDQKVWNLGKEFLSYTLSKSALFTATKMLALELAPNVRVNALGLGHVLPDQYQDKDLFEKQNKALPLQKETKLDEIYQTIRYIIETPSLTGQMIALDSGKHLL